VIGALSLAGFPGFAGFWSKDEILSSTLNAAQAQGGLYWLLLVFALLTVFITAFYTFRLIFMTFGGEFRGAPGMLEHIHEAPPTMTLPLLILAVPAVVVGFWGAPFLGNGFGQYLEGAEFHAEEMNVAMAGIGTVLALAGILVAYLFYGSRAWSAEAVAARFNAVYVTLFNRYWIDELYCWLMDKFIIWVAFFLGWFDSHVVDGVVNGVGKGTTAAGDVLRGLQTGRIPSYALAVAGGLVIIAFWAIVSNLIQPR
jgi:NADH-quinone oxidoreductase subunit L